VAGMKQTLLILMAVALVGCGPDALEKSEAEARKARIEQEEWAKRKHEKLLATKVEINDPIVYEYLCKKFGKPYGKLAPPADFNMYELSEIKNYFAVKTATDATLKDVAKFPNLTRLSLRDTQITDAGLKELVNLESLDKLNLSGTKITDAGLRELAKIKGFVDFDQVTSNGDRVHLEAWVKIDLFDCSRITDAGLRELGKIEALRELDLRYTQITDAGLKELAKCQRLTILDLGSLPITDAGLRELTKLQNLTRLDLGNTKITDASLKELVKLKNLDKLDLSGTKITDAGVAELRKAMRHWEIKK
jgi:Leucine-rich repeat (LRR) protein